MNTATLVVRCFTLAVAVTVAGCAGAGTGANEGDTLDVEAGSEEEGLRATTAIDGEVVVIEAHAVVEPGVTDDGAAFDDLGPNTFQNETWYNVWMVVNNSANSFQVWIDTGSEAPAFASNHVLDPVGGAPGDFDFGFRNGAAAKVAVPGILHHNAGPGNQGIGWDERARTGRRP